MAEYTKQREDYIPKYKIYVVCSCYGQYLYASNYLLNCYNAIVESDLQNADYTRIGEENLLFVYVIDDVMSEYIEKHKQDIIKVHQKHAIGFLDKYYVCPDIDKFEELGTSIDVHDVAGYNQTFKAFYRPVDERNYNNIKSYIESHRYKRLFDTKSDSIKFYISFFESDRLKDVYHSNPSKKNLIALVKELRSFKIASQLMKDDHYYSAMEDQYIYTDELFKIHDIDRGDILNDYIETSKLYGDWAFNDKKYKEAIEFYTKAKNAKKKEFSMQKNHDYYIYNAYIIKCLFKLAKYDEAIECFEEAKDYIVYNIYPVEYLTLYRYAGLCYGYLENENLKYKTYYHLVSLYKNTDVKKLSYDRKEIYNHVCRYMMTYFKKKNVPQQLEKFELQFIDTYCKNKSYRKIYHNTVKKYAKKYKEENNIEKAIYYYTLLTHSYDNNIYNDRSKMNDLVLSDYVTLVSLCKDNNYIKEAKNAYNNYLIFYNYNVKNNPTIKQIKDYSYVHYQLGLIYENEEKYKEALTYYLKDLDNCYKIYALEKTEYNINECICTLNKVEELSKRLKKHDLYYIQAIIHTHMMIELSKLDDKYQLLEAYNYCFNSGNYLSSIECYDYALELHQFAFNGLETLSFQKDIGYDLMLEALAQTIVCSGSNYGIDRALIYLSCKIHSYNKERNAHTIIEVGNACQFVASTYLRFNQYANANEYILKAMNARRNLKGLVSEEDYDWYQALCYDWYSYINTQARDFVEVCRCKHGLKYCTSHLGISKFNDVHSSITDRIDEAKRQAGFMLFNKDIQSDYYKPYLKPTDGSVYFIHFDEISIKNKILNTLENIDIHSWIEYFKSGS